jgi:hypothetical protein
MKMKKRDNVLELVAKEADGCLKLSNGMIEFMISNPGSPITKLLNDVRIPGKISYWLAKTVSAMQREVKVYFEVKQKIIGKYAQKEEDGSPVIQNNQYLIPPENLRLFMEEIQPITDIEVQLVGIKKIVINLDVFPEGILTASDMLSLESICEFTGEGI